MSVIIAPTQISDAIKPYEGVPPSTLSGSTPINGTSIDRLGGDTSAPYESMDLEVSTGASTGSPSSYAHTFALQHSTASGSGFVAYTDPTTGSAVVVTASADASMFRAKVNLKGANQYVRVVCTPAFTGGTSPATPIGCHMVFGGAAVSPTP